MPGPLPLSGNKGLSGIKRPFTLSIRKLDLQGFPFHACLEHMCKYESGHPVSYPFSCILRSSQIPFFSRLQVNPRVLVTEAKKCMIKKKKTSLRSTNRTFRRNTSKVQHNTTLAPNAIHASNSRLLPLLKHVKLDCDRLSNNVFIN